MRFTKSHNSYLIRLNKGEKILETLTAFCKSENLLSGSLSGLGSASEIELGYYALDTKEYHWKKFDGTYEILNMTGNLSLVDGNPFIHIHSVLSDENYQTFGGHLKEAVAGATVEIFLTLKDYAIERKMDDEIGLKLLDLENEFNI